MVRWMTLALLLVERLLLGARTIRALCDMSAHITYSRRRQDAYHHLLKLVAHTHAGDLLQVLEAGKDLVLDLELCLHAERGAFLDGEGLVVEGLERTG